MATCTAGHFHPQPDRVLIVVDAHLDDLLRQSAGRALVPEAPAMRLRFRPAFIAPFVIRSLLLAALVVTTGIIPGGSVPAWRRREEVRHCSQPWL